MNDNYHLTAKGFLDILNLCYWRPGENNTSTRNPESFKVILDTIMSSSSEFASVYNESKNYNMHGPGPMLDFSQKMNTSITLEYLAGLIDGDGRRVRAGLILVQQVHELLVSFK